MVQGDNRRSFCQSIALDDCESHPAPELFNVGRQRRRADDEGPELQTKG
jgi:hypothetical protein